MSAQLLIAKRPILCPFLPPVSPVAEKIEDLARSSSVFATVIPLPLPPLPLIRNVPDIVFPGYPTAPAPS